MYERQTTIEMGAENNGRRYGDHDDDAFTASAWGCKDTKRTREIACM